MSGTSIELQHQVAAGHLSKPNAIHLTSANNTLPASTSQDFLILHEDDDGQELTRVPTVVETKGRTAVIIAAVSLVTAT